MIRVGAVTYTNDIARGRRCPHCGTSANIDDNGCRGLDRAFLCTAPVARPQDSSYYGVTDDPEILKLCGMQWDVIDHPDEEAE